MVVKIISSSKEHLIRDMNNTDCDMHVIHRLCHQRYSSSCVDHKRHAFHIELLKLRPHWSVLKREEQFKQIDLGETIPFNIALPLPARDPDSPYSDQGVKLFWETFECHHCGKCCYTPGAGIYLEMEDFERIAAHIGKKKLKSYCSYDKSAGAWVIKQPCHFYDKGKKECQIYNIRPLTCTKYPLHPPLQEMPYNLAVDAFCPAARDLVKKTLGWWIICENNWAKLLSKVQR
jgi:Fe-S-cluster containining protein